MINVVTADDSILFRQALKETLESSGKIKVLAAARNGIEAIQYVKEYKPDVLILDCEMPVMDGLEALRRIMAETPLPVFMFSSLTRDGADITIRALEYGAVDYLLKPTSESAGLDVVVKELIHKIEVIMIRSNFLKLQTVKPATAFTRRHSLDALPERKIDLITVGSSTGGVQAAMKVIAELPENIPPVAWVQHMPAQFTKSFAERLNGLGRCVVKEAEDGEALERGVCYIAPGGIQMRVSSRGKMFFVSARGNEKVSGFCPSCNVLFSSAAQAGSNNILGVILTGMGNDGAEGLKKMRQNGSFVIGQDSNSCVVYGMPKVAFEMGAVDAQFDIVDMGSAIKKVSGLLRP
jgi:two-component system chemotaxis response regulator CheB